MEHTRSNPQDFSSNLEGGDRGVFVVHPVGITPANQWLVTFDRTTGYYHYVMLIVIAPLLILFSTACNGLLEPVATPTPDIPQVVRGETHYQTYCASCHDQEGGIGPVLKKKVIASHSSAKSLFKYTKKFMPYGAGGVLQEQEYWDIRLFRNLLRKRQISY